MLDESDFLPEDQVANGVDYLMGNIPDVEGLEALVDYFSGTYHNIQPSVLHDGILLPLHTEKNSSPVSTSVVECPSGNH